MAKHNDKEFQEKMKAQKRIETVFRHHLEKQLRNGIAQGMYAACKVISDITADAGKTADERLAAISTFCEPALKSHDARQHIREKAGD